MKKILSLFREEDGAVEMLQVVVLLALAAMVTMVLFATQEAVSKWGKPLVGNAVFCDWIPLHEFKQKWTKPRDRRCARNIFTIFVIGEFQTGVIIFRRRLNKKTTFYPK